MSARRLLRKSRAWAAAGALILCATLTGSARAATSATLAPRLTPERLGAKAAMRLTIHFAGIGGGLPSPVRRAVLRLPAGLTLDVPHLRSCSSSRLRSRGAGGCPAKAALGRGHALVEAIEGSQSIAENVSLWAFLGPLHNLQPTIELLAQGFSPLQEEVVLDGALLPTDPPYGEALTLVIPAIPTLALEPDAAIVTFSLAIGTPGRGRPRGGNTVRVPAHCPKSGFPFAAEFTYADGSLASASATVPCP
ncbi:MAG: hypothetical protein H0X28_05885 [Solirubrobacterales bacterium]|nr:hypothetical protein [Solirubrobacterales bacterium]